MRYPLFLFQPVAFGDAKETRTPIDGLKDRFPNLLEDGTVWWRKYPDLNGDGLTPYSWLSTPLPYQLGLYFHMVERGISPFIPPPLPIPAVRLAFQILFRIAVLILSQVVSIHAQSISIMGYRTHFKWLDSTSLLIQVFLSTTLEGCLPFFIPLAHIGRLWLGRQDLNLRHMLESKSGALNHFATPQYINDRPKVLFYLALYS